MWAVTRHDGRPRDAEPTRGSRSAPTATCGRDVPEHCLPYMRTMQEMDGARARPAAPAGGAGVHRPPRRRVPAADRARSSTGCWTSCAHAEDGTVDLLRHFARPLPMDVICELVGIPEADRPGGASGARRSPPGTAQQFAEAIPAHHRGRQGGGRPPRAASRARTCCRADPHPRRGRRPARPRPSWSPWSGTWCWPARRRPT